MHRVNVSRRYLPVAVLGVLTAVVLLALGWQSGTISSWLRRGEVPSFELRDRQGATFRSASLRGAPALIHFWASWCAPCLEELPAWFKKVEESSGGALKFVAISLDTQWSDADSVLSKSKVPAGLVLLIDPEQASSESFGSYQFPETYLIDAEGRVLKKWVGAQNWASIDFERILSQGGG
jgi:cytochrome c biogenesis protein CcmG/thiol:disulfide interchange protein DsbE